MHAIDGSVGRTTVLQRRNGTGSCRRKFVAIASAAAGTLLAGGLVRVGADNGPSRMVGGAGSVGWLVHGVAYGFDRARQDKVDV